jgi:hypothetical protein
MIVPSTWPQVLDFFGTPLVIEPWPAFPRRQSAAPSPTLPAHRAHPGLHSCARRLRRRRPYESAIVILNRLISRDLQRGFKITPMPPKARRAGLKIRSGNTRVGSSPTFGTNDLRLIATCQTACPGSKLVTALR